MHNLLIKITTWQGKPWAVSSIWNKNPNSQAKQNSLWHKWLKRAALSGSIKYRIYKKKCYILKMSIKIKCKSKIKLDIQCTNIPTLKYFEILYTSKFSHHFFLLENSEKNLITWIKLLQYELGIFASKPQKLVRLNLLKSISSKPIFVYLISCFK